MSDSIFNNGSPNGSRTRVSAVRGRYPRPLDDGTIISITSVKSKVLTTESCKQWLGDQDSNLD